MFISVSCFVLVLGHFAPDGQPHPPPLDTRRSACSSNAPPTPLKYSNSQSHNIFHEQSPSLSVIVETQPAVKRQCACCLHYLTQHQPMCRSSQIPHSSRSPRTPCSCFPHSPCHSSPPRSWVTHQDWNHSRTLAQACPAGTVL
jgi:hypothetical protein